MRRVVSVWLPHFAVERYARLSHSDHLPPPGQQIPPRQMRGRSRAQAEPPFALIEQAKGGLRIAVANGAAEAVGISPGQRLADARALMPSLDVADLNRAGDAAALVKLAAWATRYTPWTRAEELPDETQDGAGLLLDISGCAHLFGGERALLDDIVARLARFGFSARAAVADTVGVAWAVARCADQSLHIVGPGEGRLALKALPVRALRLPAGMPDDLRRLGLETIGDLAARPRAPLVARFGKVLGERLDEAMGLRAEPVAPEAVPVPVRARLLFADPLIALDGILAAILLAARDLSVELERRREGARRLGLRLFRVDGESFSFEAGTSEPLKVAERMARLFSEKLVPSGGMSGADIDIGYGIEGLVLEALAVDVLDPRQASLDATPDEAAGVAELIDRISNRLGVKRVTRFKPHASYIPECAELRAPALDAAGLMGATIPLPLHGAAPLRPIRLLAQPEAIEVMAEVPEGPPRRFRWRRVLHGVSRADGPERISPEWWRDDAGATRDYFRVEDEEGRRFWLYREGLYARETADPKWFLHGIFG